MFNVQKYVHYVHLYTMYSARKSKNANHPVNLYTPLKKPVYALKRVYYNQIFYCDGN